MVKTSDSLPRPVFNRYKHGAQLKTMNNGPLKKRINSLASDGSHIGNQPNIKRGAAKSIRNRMGAGAPLAALSSTGASFLNRAILADTFIFCIGIFDIELPFPTGL